MWNQELQNKLFNDILPMYEKEAFDLSDYMADNPELGYEEFKSSEAIVNLLRKHGLEVEYPFAGLATAFKAKINGNQKKRAAFLAEYDALPNGHACGHCAHGSSTILAILALNKVKDQLGDIEIDVIGTPNEEMGMGKIALQREGVFKEYDFVAMTHMNKFNIANVRFSAIDGRRIIFRGKPSHAAASPQTGRNALNAIRLLFDCIDMMRQHIVDGARIHGYIVNGGLAENIIPDYTEAVIMTRAPKRAQLNDITAWVADCAKAASIATRTEYEIIQYGEDNDAYFVGPKKEQFLKDCFKSIGLEDRENPNTNDGSSDFGNVTSECLAFHPFISIGENFELHTDEFAAAMKTDKTHQAIVNGSKYLLELAFQLYSDEALLKELREEQFAMLEE